MGFLSKIFGAAHGGGFSASVGSSMLEITRTDEQSEMLRNGYKENFSHEIFAPDTVWVGPRSKVYHFLDSCSSGVLPDGSVAIPEGEALRRGLHRCKKCDWGNVPVPPPASKPMRDARPVSRCKVRKIR